MSKAKPYTAPKRTSPSQIKGTLLYLFLFPVFLSVALALFQTNIQAFLLNSISFFLFIASLNIAKRGFKEESIYHQNTFTKAPKIPYKMIGGYLLGGATLFTSFVAGGEPIIKSTFLAIIAIVGYYLYYGFDPKKDKLENLGDISAQFVLQTIHEAKTKLANIQKDMLKIKDTLLHKKLDIAVVKAKNIIETIQEDPKDVRVARKFLLVYIDGVSKITDAYTAMDEKDITTQTKEKLHILMREVEERFDKELIRLKSNNEFDLDVHINVLKEQIKN